MDPACLPPDGTVDRSLHWIEHVPSGRLRVMEWCAPVWFAIGDPCELYPLDLAAKGYRHVCPCVPPGRNTADTAAGS